MKRDSSLLFLLALSWFCLAPTSSKAAESYDSCTGFITALPATISTTGIWCMNSSLAGAETTGNAITIDADNVTIDCNDFKLDGSAAGVGTTRAGIFADSRLNVTVRHCNILGFFQGIELLGTVGGHVVEDNRVDSNTFVGIHVRGDSSIVRRNEVINTGGTTAAATTFGIYTVGAVDLIDNMVAGVLFRAGPSGGNAFGIYTTNQNGGSVNGNRVRGVTTDGTRYAYGIYNANSTRLVLRSNDVVGTGDASSIGITCTTASGRARDNVVNGFPTGIYRCANVIANDSSP